MKQQSKKNNIFIKFSILGTLVTTVVFSYFIFDVSAGQIINKLLKRDSLESGLVGHWTFDGKDMILNVADVSGVGNHGTIVGQISTTTVVGVIGQAMSFDGIDDYVDIPDNSTLDVANITISVWVKTDTAGRYIFAKDPPLNQ